jgi:signal transduction histidine kinase
MIGSISLTKQQLALQQLLPELTDNQIETIEKAARSQSYKAGEIICRQGDSGDTFFILIEGRAEFLVRADDKSELLARIIEAPGYFGETALLGRAQQPATVRAGALCRTAEIDRNTFLAVVESNRMLLTALSNRISDHLHHNDQTIIAELRRKNESLQTAHEIRAEQERLRAELITNLSHELHTPLTSIQGFLNMLSKSAVQGRPLEMAMDSVNRNVEKMIRLTNHLRVLYEMQLSEPAMTSLNVADLLIDAMQEARAVQGDYITPIALTMYPGATRLQGDKPGLSLVLRSLIENALKFSPDHSPISITVSKPKLSEICIEIADQGIGVPGELLGHIFEPIFRGEAGDDGGRHPDGRNFSGLEVGLAITHFIVKQHNGRIEGESKPGQGSIFRIFLPHNHLLKSAQSQNIVGSGQSKINGFRAGVYSAVVNS